MLAPFFLFLRKEAGGLRKDQGMNFHFLLEINISSLGSV